MGDEGGSEVRFRIGEGLVHRAVGGEVFVLMADSTVHWLKNASAVCLWSAIVAAGSGGIGTGPLARTLEAEFDVGSEGAEADALAFVSDLVRLGVLATVVSDRGVRGAD